MENRAEAERLLGIAEKFLHSRDLASSRDFAVLAQETAPLLDGSDQILAISDVLLAADNKKINNRPNWYSILQLDSRSDNLDVIKKQYRRLALLLHPDKNKYPFAHDAFQLVADAWAVLSDQTKKRVFDNEHGVFSRVTLTNQKQNNDKYKSTTSAAAAAATSSQPRRLSSFWTACPYCYNLYEYPRIYQDCVLKCGNCNRAIHATEISTLPPVVQGQEAYYCCWGFFPMGFSGKNGEVGNGSGRKDSGVPNWTPPPVFSGGVDVNMNGGDEEFMENSAGNVNGNRSGNVTPVHRNVNIDNVNVTPIHRNVIVTTGAKKRGRPRKNM